MVALNSTDEWTCNGEFTTEFGSEDAATDSHTLELNDGKNTVAEEDELVKTERRQLRRSRRPNR